MTKNTVLRNEEIRSEKVMVVNEFGKAVGEMPTPDAIDMAASADLDLVLVAPGATPPVCRIVDYGKYIYEMSKKEKQNKKKQKTIEIKEIRMTPSIGEEDLKTKVRAAKKFLADGDKVKTTIRFHGREAARPDDGIKVLNRFVSLLKDVSTADKNVKREGRNISLMVVPKISSKGNEV